MPFAIHSFMIGTDDQIRLCHVFYGATKHEALNHQKDHARECPYYGPALAKGEVIDVEEELDVLPQPEMEELLEFLDLMDEEDEEDGGV
jgi:hypothetical protein